MSGNEQIKMQKIVLNQLGNDPRLNNNSRLSKGIPDLA